MRRRADGTLVRMPEPSPAEALVALQRGAGNQAVARMMAARRTLARSCDNEDADRQMDLHQSWTEAIIGEGASMVRPFEGRGRRPQQPMQGGTIPTLFPTGGGSEVEMHLGFEGDDEGAIYESDYDDQDPPPEFFDGPEYIDDSGSDFEMDDEPQEQQQNDPLIFFPPHQRVYPLSFLLQHMDMQQLQEVGAMLYTGQQQIMMQRVQRTLARERFTGKEDRTRTSPKGKTHKFTGFVHGDNPDTAPTGVGDQTKVKRRGLQQGTPTDAVTRPPGWWGFIPLVGLGPGLGRCTYVMGHLLNADFGGYGTVMYNLSPFSARLNAHHKTQVESPLRNFLKGAKEGHKRKIDYTVKANYGAPADMVGDAGDRFDRFLRNNRSAALRAWVKLKLIDAEDVENLEDADVTDAIDLKHGGTWDVLVANVRTQVTQYVTLRFPQSITCTARQYDIDKANGATDWEKTDTLIHTIPHVR